MEQEQIRKLIDDRHQAIMHYFFSVVVIVKNSIIENSIGTTASQITYWKSTRIIESAAALNLPP